MKLKINNLLKINKFRILNSLFTKLMASFLLVICVISSFHLFSYRLYVNNIKTELFNNENANLNRTVDEVESYLNQMQRTLVRLYLQKNFQKIMAQNYILPYDHKILIDECVLYTYDFAYYSTYFLYTQKSDYIITSNGTYEKERYFNRFYKSNKFTKNFWDDELRKDFTYKIYPGDYFEDKRFNDGTSNYLVPLAFKNSTRNDMLVIVLVDINHLISSVTDGNSERLYITNENNETIYSDNSSIEISGLSIGNDLGSRKNKINKEYLISRTSNTSGLKYYRMLDDKLIKNQLKTTSLLYVFIFLISLFVSILISVYIVIKVNNPVKQIGDIIKKSNKDMLQKDIGDLKNIRDYIKKLDTVNSAYEKEISSKDSILQTFFYQAKVKNIYSFISLLKEQISIKSDYFIVYFKLHYKPQYYSEISMEPSKGTYYLKEYIQLKIENCSNRSVTFNMEDDQIVSIINVGTQRESFKRNIQKILEVLKTEEDYMFLTVVISEFYENISELGDVFNKLVKISKHRKLTDETQLMEEESFNFYNSKIYFSSEQARRFSDLLQKGEEQQCIELTDKILDDNNKSGINAFYITLLCNELVNCCIKSLVENYYNVPEKFDIDSTLSRLNKCATIDDYKEVCTSFIFSVANYFKTHAQEKDYIIDYVKEYIEKNYNEDIYLELLADKLNITKAYLSLYFKNKTGINLSEFLKNYRMQKAKEMLDETALKIQEVSNLIGIPNVNTFIRLFRAYTGVTPGEYRKNRIKIE